MKRKVEFLLSAAAPAQFPESPLPEVAFLGRSNVGKSSLINALVGQPGVAKTSATPGCTRLINFFRVEDRFRLVDLPGYGYARGPVEDKLAWGRLIESYLREREMLRLCIVLVDARRGWMDLDLELKSWLGHHNRPFVVAATKVDKLNQKELHRGLTAIRQEIGQPERSAATAGVSAPVSHEDPPGVDPLNGRPPAEEIPIEGAEMVSKAAWSEDVIPCSVRTGRGVRELWQTIWKRTNP